jgi:hypothetical protein
MERSIERPMSTAHIKSIIETEGTHGPILGRVTGTPRTYGDRKSEDKWRACIAGAAWKGLERYSLPLNEPLFLTFLFRVNPNSIHYRNRVSPNGPDLDTMVIGAMGGIVVSKTGRPGLGLIARATCCWGYGAVKEIVGSDEKTGVDISIRPSAANVASLSESMPQPTLEIRVPVGADRRAAAQAAAQTQNASGLHFPACSPVGMTVAFSSATGKRNVTCASHIEALIDGMGAAMAGERRLFDQPHRLASGRYGYDDSCISALLVWREPGQVDSDAHVRFYVNELAGVSR